MTIVLLVILIFGSVIGVDVTKSKLRGYKEVVCSEGMTLEEGDAAELRDDGCLVVTHSPAKLRRDI